MFYNEFTTENIQFNIKFAIKNKNQLEFNIFLCISPVLMRRHFNEHPRQTHDAWEFSRGFSRILLPLFTLLVRVLCRTSRIIAVYTAINTCNKLDHMAEVSFLAPRM